MTARAHRARTPHAGAGSVRHAAALLVALAMVGGACSGGGDDDPETSEAPTTDPAGRTGPVEVVVAGVPGTGEEGPVLGLRLSEGSPDGVEAAPLRIVDGIALDADEVGAILARLPEWDVPDTDRDDFNRPAESLRPPVAGTRVDAAFPPAVVAPPDVLAPATGPLEVLRFQPEGDVATAPFLSLTFNEPMVPIATLDQLDAADVPVTVTPEIRGRWRWIGTRTLRFEVVPGEIDRLPAATEYTVEVPAGTTSAHGATLDEAVGFTFRTPAPTVRSVTGITDSMSLTPIVVAVFDQRVDPDAVLAATTLTADGERPLRLASAAEIEADDTARQIMGQALPDRAVVVRPVDPLPSDTAVTLAIGPGTPSLEGPRTSESAHTERGRTHAPLRVVRHSCNWGGACVPGSALVVEFNNELDPVAFRADLVAVEPAIPGERLSVYGNVVEIAGATAARTTYTVNLGGALADVFGQTLGQDETLEFEIGRAQPLLAGPQQQFVTTDPFAERAAVEVSTINHDRLDVTAWRVTPDQYDEYVRYLEQRWSDTAPADPTWPVVLDTTLDVDADEDRLALTAIDLTDALAQAGGFVVVRVQPDPPVSPRDELYWQNQPIVTWVQATQIGIDAILARDELLVWTTDLRTGEPLPGVAIEVLGGGTLTTDADGLAQTTFSRVRGLVASLGDDRAMLPSDWWDGWEAQPAQDEALWYTFDDRGTYRPGETVRVAGWVRRLEGDDLDLALFADATVRATVYDPQGSELVTEELAVNALGGFNLAVELPDGANLGQGWIELRLLGAGVPEWFATQHYFQVQDYRTPEFQVTARPETPAPYFAARPATVAVDAEYFAGGPLPEAQVDWWVTSTQTSYQPPNWDEYTFGIWTPWWFGGPERAEVFSEPCFDCGPIGGQHIERYTGRTDAGGTHYLRIDFGDAATEDGPPVDLPWTVTAEATVFDVNRQAWTSRTGLLVHAAQLYVGARADRAFVEQGTPIRVDTVVTDVDGATVAGREVSVVAGRVEWARQDDGTYAEEIVDPQTCELTSVADPTVTAESGPMRCEFATAVGGTYRITATVTDDDGRTNRTELTQWVTGGDVAAPQRVEQEQVTMVPDRETYAPGDTAEVFVQAPFAPATALVTVTRAGIESTYVLDAPDGSAVARIPVAADDVPNLDVQVEMVGSTERTGSDGTPLPDLPRRPAYAAGSITLAIPPRSRTLSVVATPAADAVEPGADTTVTVAVTGPDGAPIAGADVAVVVVDEAVLALSGYTLTDPLAVFYGQRYGNVWSQYVRASLLLDRPDLFSGVSGEGDDSAGGAVTTAATDASAPAEEPAAEEAATADAADGAARDLATATTPIDVRADFDALAVWAPDETTGADGTVTVDVELPDNLTRYRVMAVAVDGPRHFGTGEANLTARLPLMVRPSAPRFLNFGDVFELPVVLQNQTDQPLEVDLALQTANLGLPDAVVAGDDQTLPAAGRRVTVPANDRVEVRFAAAAEDVGTARFRVAGVSGSFADAATIELPVYTPATAEAFATYGVVDDAGAAGAVAQPVLAPTDVFPQFGGLEISTSSTALQALTDAVLWLYEYRYDSADGYANRLMSIAALRDVLDAFDAEGLPAPAAIERRAAADLAALAALQNDDGGFPWWQRGRPSEAWISVTVGHALVVARDAGYDVPSATLDRVLGFVADIEQHIDPLLDQRTKDTISAYALHVRDLAGQRDAAKAQALYDRAGDDLQLDAIAWLWPTLAGTAADAEIERLFENRAVETPSAATFATDYGEDAWVIANSDRRTDGVILDALVRLRPESDLVPKVVDGLIGNQRRGRWDNVYENSFILLAMKRYFDTFEATDPDFVARAWLGDLYAAESTFAGRSVDTVTALVPMDELIAGGDSTITVAKDGSGRLYYRLGLRYAPDDLRLDARDEGFVVDREYEAVDEPGDVVRNADGTWTIRAGATVRVKLTMVADAQRTNVALLDPLPAGLEPVNPALAVSAVPPVPGDPSAGLSEEEIEAGVADAAQPAGDWSWWGPWWQHQNLRDDRAEAFAGWLPAGTYEYEYTARATTPGTFVVPPARAEEIYAPEVFGRSAATTVVVR